MQRVPPCRRVKHRLISLNFSSPRRNYPTISKTLPALEYLHPPSPAVSPPAGGGRGLFKLKSRQDLNFKISIWLANLSASFRPRERTTALPSLPRRGQIARVRHQKSFTSRALFLYPPSPHSSLLLSFSRSPLSPSATPLLLSTLLRKVAELKISSLNGDTRAPPTNILRRAHYTKKMESR